MWTTFLALLHSVRTQLLASRWLVGGLILGLVVCVGIMARGLGGVSEQTLARGAEVYVSECAHCHQLDGRGEGGRAAPDFVANPMWLAKSNPVLLASIAQGVPGTTMLGFDARLSTSEQRAVLAYIRARFGNTR